MDEPISARRIVTEDDYIAASEAHLRHRSTPITRLGQRFFFGLLILLSLTFPIVMFGDEPRDKKLEALVPMTATIAGLWGAWFWKTRGWRVGIRRNVRAIPEDQRRTEWTFDQDQFVSRNAASSVQTRWSVFKEAVEAPVGFLLYQSAETFSLTPAHAFTSEAELKRFAELARSKIPNYVVLGECQFPAKPEPVGLDDF
jgi:hypothetical protein